MLLFLELLIFWLILVKIVSACDLLVSIVKRCLFLYKLASVAMTFAERHVYTGLYLNISIRLIWCLFHMLRGLRELHLMRVIKMERAGRIFNVTFLSPGKKFSALL